MARRRLPCLGSWVAAVAALLAAGCEPGGRATAREGRAAALPLEWEAVAPPPAAAAATIAARWEERRHLRSRQPVVLYLNFDGADLDPGPDSNAVTNTSWWVPRPVAVPPFDPDRFGATREDAIMTVVERVLVAYAGFDVHQTLERPASGDYTMAVIGGAAALIDQELGVLGVAPADCSRDGRTAQYDINPLDIVFVFSDDAAGFGLTLDGLADVVIHEVGHALGLTHVERVGDLMSSCIGVGEVRSWGAGVVERNVASCSPDGFQDDLDVLEQAIGPALSSRPAPTVTLTSPVSGVETSGLLRVTSAGDAVDGPAWQELFVDGTWTSRQEGPRAAFGPYLLAPGAHSLQVRLGTWSARPSLSPVVDVFVPAPAPRPCAADDDCWHDERCQGGACAPAPPPPIGGALGAACVNDDDCISGHCLDSDVRYCGQPCRETAGARCPAGYSCAADESCHSLAATPPGAVGSPCTADTQCQHLLCVNAASGGYCSAACEPGGAFCPSGVPCVDDGAGGHVCGRAAAGCQIARDGAVASPLVLATLLAALAIGRRRPPRRRRR